MISCWTNITHHKDDKLIWYKYAGGLFGAGITAEYGLLRDALKDRIGELSLDGHLICGSVNYDSRVNKLPPFNKRSGFRGENEVRFAMRHVQYGRFVAAELSEKFLKLFGLRLSEDSPEHHKDALKKLWVAAGGNPDRITEG